MLPGKPLELDMTGSLTSTPYALAVNIASLKEFLTENRSWMEIKAEIAGTKLLFKGDINLAEAHRSLALKGSVLLYIMCLVKNRIMIIGTTGKGH